ncbi:DUF5906 domain-containing protein [[Clostridium] innocuum]|uniref:DUF5906 domain-containing protein n=1 Tax=Clostridium innocuum TaxID=1522 RepID=UPI001E61A45D|nr:DUF5906 domain-containing protein [[Clostridium] innocuum]DAU14204.1 MAG TPA: DNA polymerase [Caudoviricetes sp.]MCC2832075.1 DUF5906 domain-containing protein [[Clostridium] innocuum]MCR0247001.1 DUF5906 domain-containing protein [[Clostridium] innocuum]MCR0258363.1 DUF5906 domain-containing protein [[Clostridium] innocuum]MCR0391061.1 DUF5906 domain-containing protein [[Clostridium] innocuum]
MIDFLMISYRSPKQGVIEIYPKFIIKKSNDLMIRGGDFYAVWMEKKGLWSTDEQDVVRLVDKELKQYADANKNKFEGSIHILYMWDADSGVVDRWHKYCQRQMRDNYHMLDEKLIFSNDITKKEDYASKRLPYPLEAGDISAYDELMSILYSEDERHKLEWAIGAIVSGDSKIIQKFMVLYGSAGTGKSTVLNIIQQLFDGYCSIVDAKALGSANNAFALEAFKENPLVAIQHDSDLSRIEDNTRLNSLVSHELMTINEKFKSTYANQFKCFLFLGTNKPVRITDGKSGLIRRLIDVSPTGDKVSTNDYKRLTKQISFELGGIAYHCRDVYLSNPGRYDGYIPKNMMGATNDFYNFVEDSYFVFKKENGTTLKAAWEMYKQYCDDARVQYPNPRRIFKEELKNYFTDFEERALLDDGTRVRNYYRTFKADIFDTPSGPNADLTESESVSNWLKFDCTESVFDKESASYLAQYATDGGIPMKAWDKVKTRLCDLDTSKLHYVKVPEQQHIVADFDIPDENGKKNFKLNLEAASKWPATYAELSKSGEGIHLHYIYTGDVNKLRRLYGDHIEIKVFVGKSSLRRKLTKCNNLPIATISSGLPLKGDDKMVDFGTVKSEKSIRDLIKRNLNKEIHPATKPSIDFIHKILEDAYSTGLNYDVTDMRNAVLAFAASSSHQSDYCIKLVNKMQFKSTETSENVKNDDAKLIFYDVEVFPNLFVICWKMEGEGKPVVKMINPNSTEIEELMQFRLVGFNCRRYDNHILYARLMGYTNEQLYNLSQKIISGSRNAFFGEAYNVSYTDIYDFASAGNKKSLKKLEIEMGIHHQELGLPWNQPVAENLWEKVADYCTNDVIATEAAFNYLSADWTARQILADLAGLTVNDTTNTLTTKIIFGNNRNPQNQFNYRDMGETNLSDYVEFGYDDYTRFNKDGFPIFPGYKYEFGKSIYRGEEIGEGGYVYAEPGMYGLVALLDIVSMHPHSAIAELLFGEEFTRKFKEIVDGRVAIKHEDWDSVNNILDGKLTPYIQKVINGEMTSKELANALKTAINSVYGLTSAKFDNPFRDPRNKDNIVAKRGALFMVNLKHEVQNRGFTVAHIKTDSIKIPDATPEIIQFVMDYGKMYGYEFEHEATYEKMCLVNDAVYIAKDASDGHWTATGTQFQIPYVFKNLFTKESITFDDMCEIKAVSKGTLCLDMNEGFPDVSKEEKELLKIQRGLRVHMHYHVYGECNMSAEQYEAAIAELKSIIDTGHKYIFVGKVGQFCPIKPDCGGGILYRENEGKYYAAAGTKGYRWLESEMVKELNKEDDIDKNYYDNLANEAIETISKYGDFEWFVSDDPYISPPYDDRGRPIYLDCGTIATDLSGLKTDPLPNFKN